MVGHTEIAAGLTKMAILATRRVGEDQLRQLADQWVEGLRDVEPVGFRRAAKAYGDEGKWPALGEFRTRAKAMTPGMRAPEDAPPEYPACPVGHRYVWRKWSNRSGRVQGVRAWCPCADRAAALYGETWGEEVPDSPSHRVALQTLAGQVGRAVG